MIILKVIISIGVLLSPAFHSDNGFVDSNSYESQHITKQFVAKKEVFMQSDTSNMKKYQTFDEFTMRGVGQVKDFPFVYVKESPNRIYVVSSCQKDSARLYEMIDGKLWYNHMEYNMWKKNDVAYNDKKNCNARTYDRYFYNDTIVEIRTDFVEGEKYPSAIVKTHKELYEIDLTSIDSSEYVNINRLRKRVYSIIHSKAKNVWKSYLEESSNSYSYVGNGHKINYQYQKKPYGLWGIQPGIEETFLYGGIDIREYADNLRDFQENNPDFVFEFTDEMPTFPKGIMALYKFCRKKMNDSLLFNHDVPQNDTRIVIDVVIEKDGSITNAKISKSIDSLHDEDALKITNEMPKWIPAKLNGKSVRCKQLISIFYRKAEN